jgi:hypothetical protein
MIGLYRIRDQIVEENIMSINAGFVILAFGVLRIVG